MLTSHFYCTYCGKESFPIIRKKGQLREPGHLKKLFCIHCKKETNQAEVYPKGTYTYEDFLKEFSLGRFIKGDRVPIGELLGCSLNNCSYNCNGKCWNANKSYKCEYRKS